MIVEGKVALVVGAARGVGKEYVRHLLEKGAKVGFGDVLDKEGRESEAEFVKEFGAEKVFYQPCDVTSDEQVMAIFKMVVSNFGMLSIFVNSAGRCLEFDWKTTLDVNLGGTIRTSNMALEHMSIEHGNSGGVIVHTSSVMGIVPAPHSPVYGATKAGIINYCRSFAVPEHYKRTGVRFNSICPPLMLTKINEEAFIPGNVYFHETNQERVKELENAGMYISTATCASAMIKVVEDETINGQAVVVAFDGLRFDVPTDYSDLLVVKKP